MAKQMHDSGYHSHPRTDNGDTKPRPTPPSLLPRSPLPLLRSWSDRQTASARRGRAVLLANVALLPATPTVPEVARVGERLRKSAMRVRFWWLEAGTRGDRTYASWQPRATRSRRSSETLALAHAPFQLQTVSDLRQRDPLLTPARSEMFHCLHESIHVVVERGPLVVLPNMDVTLSADRERQRCN